jgi:DNA-binding transcriptional ArsR family regulator
MDDERAGKIANIFGNNTCKKIIDFLANKIEASEKEISDSLNIPLNTAEYNLNKLLEAGLIEKAKKFFWSKKGKKIPLYKLSNKSIVISPKNKKLSSKIKTILPIAAVSVLVAFIIRQFSINSVIMLRQDKSEAFYPPAEGALASIPANVSSFLTQPVDGWLWFLAGAVFAIVILMIINWRKL